MGTTETLKNGCIALLLSPINAIILVSAKTMAKSSSLRLDHEYGVLNATRTDGESMAIRYPLPIENNTRIIIAMILEKSLCFL